MGDQVFKLATCLMYVCARIHNTNSELDIQSTDGTTGDKFQDQYVYVKARSMVLVYRLITSP